MNPCKECIVRAGCTKDCKAYRNYCDHSSQLATILSIFCSAACVIFMFYQLGFFTDDGTGFNRIVYTCIWLGSAIFNVFFNYRNEERMGEFVIIIFGPFVTFVFLFLILFSLIFKNGVRKRV